MRASLGVLSMVVGLCLLAGLGEVQGQSWTNEPMPNGGRVNVGLYGGTAEASKSNTNEWLFAMSFNDGGTVLGASRLEWVAGNLGVNALVDLHYTTNNGVTWVDIVTGVAAADENYSWAPGFDYPAVKWRVVHTNSGVASTNAKAFSVRQSTNVVFQFYVNDGATLDDVFCEAVGDDANDGAASDRPMRSLQTVVSTYQLRGGDTVYVDTGDYMTNVTITISGFDSGIAGKPVKIIGSPKGATFNRGNTSADVLDLTGASNLEIENLRLTGGRSGLVGGTNHIVLRNMEFVGNTYGVNVTGSGHVFEYCLSANNSQRGFTGTGTGLNQWNNGVMWGNPIVVHAVTNTLSISNSILGQATTLFGNRAVNGDYNLVWNCSVGAGHNTFTLLQNAGLWTNSLYSDPLFANTEGEDYHLKSVMGRYDPGTGLFVTNDVEHSPGIDLGNPAAPVGDEPLPNGARLNAGLYGGTAQASKSRTNAWIQLMNYQDGGTLDAQVGAWIRWNTGNLEPGATVGIWLSRDDGSGWELLVDGLAAEDGAFFYQDPDPKDTSSLYGRLKVTLDDVGPEASSQSATNFIYKNGMNAFYVNDDSLEGDVYCSAIGDNNNLGVGPGAPMASLAALVNRYTLVPGDRVYVDTGVYTETDAVRFTSDNSGSETNRIEIIGSTNRLVGGTVIRGRGMTVQQRLNPGFEFRAGASNIVLRNMILTNTTVGVVVSNSAHICLDGVEVRGASSRAFEVRNNAKHVEIVHSVAHRGAGGVYLAGNGITNVAIRHSVFWENSGTAVQRVGAVGLTLENSILASTQVGAYLLDVNNLAGFASDYNGLHAGPNTRVGRVGSVLADNVAAWQVVSGGRDLHSVPGAPLMANPDAFDYHLQTVQTLGRVKPDGTRTADPVSSPLLDAGNPDSDFGDEPAPHGGRVNIGRYGGTAEASSAQEIPWVRAMSFGDGGAAGSDPVGLYWVAGNVSNETANVEVSVDGGRNWQAVASGVELADGQAEWPGEDLADLPDTPAAVWRLVSVEDPALRAQSEVFFALRKNPLNIYVATGDTNENIYATGPGAADNWQATKEMPINSLRTVFERFDLEEGDQIWVDPGIYSDNEAISIGMKNSGTPSNPVWVRGNTQRPYLSTVLAREVRTAGSVVVDIQRAGGVRLEALSISNGWSGIRVGNTDQVVLDRVRVVGGGTNAVQAGSGATVDVMYSILEGSLANGLHVEAGSTVQVEHSLLRDHGMSAVIYLGGTLNVVNSLLEATGTGKYVYYRSGTGTFGLESDFNNVRATEGANVAGGDSRSSDRFLIDWQASTGFTNDANSVGYEPLFVDAQAYDFHLCSEHGRFDPASGTFVADAVTSKLMDLGDRDSDFANEPVPNGGRANIGLYGNTVEASKSSETGALVPLTMSDGGTIRGEVRLHWSWNGIADNTPVLVDFSDDGGVTWTNISMAYASDGLDGRTWQTTNYPSTAMGVWRVATTNEPPIVGQTETYFAVKNDPVAYYINDGSTDGDVYCEAVGRPSHTGLTPDSPLDSLSTLLARYKVEHGDIVYVDTGVYARSSPLVVAIPSVGATNRLMIRGSTNEAAGGTVFTNSGNGAVLELNGCRLVDLEHFNLQGGMQGLVLRQTSESRITNVRASHSRQTAIMLEAGSTLNELTRCAALNFMQTGLHMQASTGQQAPLTNTWLNGVVSSYGMSTSGVPLATGTLVGATSGRLNISNSVFSANGSSDVIFATQKGVIKSDYNAYHRPTKALFARTGRSATFGVQSLSFAYLNTWQDENGTDLNSFEADPLFANLADGDLHPKSQAGRWDALAKEWTNDVVTSPLVDAGDPAINWGAESNRINIGVYGGTVQASRSPGETAPSFSLLTLNEGGVVRETTTLRWQARGGATNGLAHVWISTNSGIGANWKQVATNVPVLSGVFDWDTTQGASTPNARWRISHAQMPGIETTSSRDFLIHNDPLEYFVNDHSRSNDVWCTAAGSLENTGFSADSPLPSLSAVLERYDLEPGDKVWVDTGVYTSSANVGYLSTGTAEQPVLIQGSTSHAGTVFKGGRLSISHARGIHVRDFRFEPMDKEGEAISVSSAEHITLQGIDTYGRTNGFMIAGSSNVWLRHFSVTAASNGVASYASYNTCLEQGTIWSNLLSQVISSSAPAPGTGGSSQPESYVTVSNCISGSFGVRIPIYQHQGRIYANYNNLYTANGGLVGLSSVDVVGFAQELNSVEKWQSKTGNDDRSLSYLPEFADARGRDYHLKTQEPEGRWDPAAQAWTNDLATSRLLDAGAPTADFSAEPEPNGGRVNLGRFGGTAKASKTPTNGVLTLISLNDGGRVAGTEVPITWLARGAATHGTVRILFSPQGGASNTWIELVSGLAATEGSWIWDSTVVEQTVQGQFRIELEGHADIFDENDRYFAVRNQPFKFYINDGSTVDDIYCTAAGHNSNSGLTNSAPMADLNALLARYDLEGGDTVYIDTGVYQIQDPWRITQASSAGTLATNPVVIQGSTNSFPSRTVLSRQSNPMGIQVDYAVGLKLSHITVSNVSSVAVAVNNSTGVEAEWIAVARAKTAFQLHGGSHLRLAHSAVYNSENGIQVSGYDRTLEGFVAPVIEHNVLWDLAGWALNVGSSHRPIVRNNILSVRPSHYVYELASVTAMQSDYNAIWLDPGARVARRAMPRDESPVPQIFDTVGAWASANGQDLHSHDSDPKMANPGAQDFHLLSEAGRWNTQLAAWVEDEETSPLIDMGHPDSVAWTNEAWPNGGRVNIGLYGGTAQASKSSSKPALHLLTLNRGGVASGQVALNWVASGDATGHTVRVSVSVDDGESWINIASGLPALLGGVIWNSPSLKPVAASPIARWKVESEGGEEVGAFSERSFVLHNGPIAYYVNDEAHDPGDVYCTAAGSSTNTGISPDSPKRWVAEILETYHPRAGDTIYVDTGVYAPTAAAVFGDLNGGDTSQDPDRQVTILGSTNVVEGGSLIYLSNPEQYAFELIDTHGIRLRDLRIEGGQHGLHIDNSYYIAGDWLEIKGASDGIWVSGSSNLVFQHCALVDNLEAGIRFSDSRMGSFHVGSSVLWANRYGVNLQSGYAFVSNSILGAITPNSFAYYMQADRPQTGYRGSDYNNLYVGHSSAAIGGYQRGSQANARTTTYAYVSTWSAATGMDQHSLPQNPLLADPANGDYHLHSAGGRYRPGLGWQTDPETSPLIDAGRPSATAWLLEPDPNGRRQNIGRYGGTPEASKTPLAGKLTCVHPTPGARVSGDVDIRWGALGAATGQTVTIEYSWDDGISWTNIVVGWPASFGDYTWDTQGYPRSARGWWRIISDQNYAIADSMGTFMLDNEGSIPYYVNDTNTVGDVYCTAPGKDANDGLSPDSPVANLQVIIDRYDLSPEDIVYVDAGAYRAGSPPIRIGPQDSGYSNLYVTIQGSTNPAAPTIFMGTSFGAESVFALEYAEYVRLRDLTIRGAETGVALRESIACEFERVMIQQNAELGALISRSPNTRFKQSIFWNNRTLGAGGMGLSVADSSVALENCTVWQHETAISVDQGSLSVTNSALFSEGANGRIYSFGSSASAMNSYRGDYNHYTFRKNGSLLAEQRLQVGGSEYYNSIPVWNDAVGSDYHSHTLDPKFADAQNGDFHPRSTEGRWTSTGWVVDSELSPLIDAGDPAWDFSREPAPHGGRINIGAYGNTAQASMTQADPPWVLVASYNDCEDTVTGDALLYWLHGGLETNELVKLEYTTDYWNWQPITNGLPVGQQQYLWDVSEMPLAVAMNWRVVLQSNTNVFDESDCSVAIKTRNYDYFVNDANTHGDMYCSAPGVDWDASIPGTNSARPLKSLQLVLEHLPVGAGDRIFIDTGVYPVASTNRILLDDRNTGTEAFPLMIMGSTNILAGGTVFQGNGTAHGIQMRNTRHIHLQNIRVAGAQHGLLVENVDTIKVRGGEFFQNLTNGILVTGSSGLDVRNTLIWGNQGFGLSSRGARGAQNLQHLTFWGNQRGAVENGLGSLQVQNSVLVMTNKTPIYQETGEGTIGGDYNLFWSEAGGPLATNAKNKVTYSNLRQWQAGGRDTYSLVIDPLFVDAEAGNFHVASQEGYWDGDAWVKGTQTSWAIDAGHPGSEAYTNEPSPHGWRVNLGRFGGTPYASKSAASEPLKLLGVSMRDGGVATYQQELYWLYRGGGASASTNTVSLWYSPDNRGTWILLEANRSVDSDFMWESNAEPTPEAWWKVVLDADTNVFDEVGPFMHRTRPLTYYVNDESTEGDVYTTAIGAPDNLGYRAESPLDSIQAVLDKFELLPGDTVLVDTGEYELDESIYISVLQRGRKDQPVSFVGSTNMTHGGTWLYPSGTMHESAFELYNASWVNLENFRIDSFTNGVSMAENSANCQLVGLDIFHSFGPGVALTKSQDILLDRVLIREGTTSAIAVNQSRVELSGCVLWSNRSSAISLGAGGNVGVTNSVVEATDVGNFCYHSSTSAVISANYNNYVLHDGAEMASINRRVFPRIPQWTRGSGNQDTYSLSVEPYFHDPENGDFHLRSVAGRFDLISGDWTQDTPEAGLPDFSPMIDMGSPQTSWSNEPMPNGGQRNIGLYGGTSQASKSDTNDWVQVITASGGGLVSNVVHLTWGYGGIISSGQTARLEYSYDNGEANWIFIENVPIGNRSYAWPSHLEQPPGTERWRTSPAGRWRLLLGGETNVMDMTDTYFGLRNRPFSYFVNDDSTSNDIYTSAVGDDDNLGFFPEAPKRNLQSLLEEIDLEPDDQVFVDTGVYHLSDTNWPIIWGLEHSGSEANRVRLQGSTNANGSWFVATNKFATSAFFYLDADHVEMRDLKFRGESLDFRGSGLLVSNLVATNRTGASISLNVQGDSNRFENIQLDRGSFQLAGSENRLDGLLQRWGATTLSGADSILMNSAVYVTNAAQTGVVVNAVGATVSNCTIVAPSGTAVGKIGGGTLWLGHNILVAGGSHDSNAAIAWGGGDLISDWNNFWIRGSAWLGDYQGKWENLAYWQEATGQDANSVSFDPLFQNEAAGDFHLNSVAGRWSSIFNDWDTDSVHSPVIDLGNPWVGTANEPMPNGYRRNLGAYGGTAQASKSRTDFWLTAITANDGGVLKGTNVVLSWATLNNATQSIRLEYSWDGGQTWTNIASDLSASQRTYTWDTSGYPDSFHGLWRVVAADGSAGDTNDVPFALRNHAHAFYVNDTVTSDAVYCTEPGDDSHDGLSTATPKRTLQALLNEYHLQGGDTVYVDSGTYASTNDIRVIWSRSGQAGDPIVIQGNPNGPYSVLKREGATNFPALVLDVKSSNIELRNLTVTGADRGILLESNRNVTVDGSYLVGGSIGISVQSVQGTRIHRSALWKNATGIQLVNTRTSILENLTFALPAQAGIQLQGTVLDTLQNNIFIPAEGAYAYSIGASTSLLTSAFMDYNLYDFGNAGSGFFAGATNSMRMWQLTMNRDFRSALTTHGLVEVDYPGDLHPLSEYGRWEASVLGGDWRYDEGTSWAVDHGNPASDFSEEQENHGGRVNIGMYGNTPQASQGNTDRYMAVRTVDGEVIKLLIGERWPLVWESHLDEDIEVLVQFSGGATNEFGELIWTTLTNTTARQEYFIWQVEIAHQTANGLWRVVAKDDEDLAGTSSKKFQVASPSLGFISRPYRAFGLMRFDWEGGIPGVTYLIEYSDDFGETWQIWPKKYNGPAPMNMSRFNILVPQKSYTFEDRTSYQQRQRWYRISREVEEGEGD